METFPLQNELELRYIPALQEQTACQLTKEFHASLLNRLVLQALSRCSIY